MGNFKVENRKVIEGELDLKFVGLQTKYISLSALISSNPNITDEELELGLEKLQAGLIEHEQYMKDHFAYKAFNRLYNEDINNVCEFVEGEIEEVFSNEKIAELKDYVKSFNLMGSAEGYKGNLRKYIASNFPEVNLFPIVADFTLMDGVNIDKEFSFYFTPEGDEDAWHGDFVRVYSDFMVKIC